MADRDTTNHAQPGTEDDPTRSTNGADRVIREERKRLELAEGQCPRGIALSGGGIRSASFGIGVLQALERCENVSLTEDFHYLSTVSGGGYTGSAFSWFRSRQGAHFFPFGSRRSSKAQLALERREREAESTWRQRARAMPGFVWNSILTGLRAASHRTRSLKPEDILNFIRLHGKYLTPTPKLGFSSALFTVLWVVLVSSICYFALISFLMMSYIAIAQWFCFVNPLELVDGIDPLFELIPFLRPPGDLGDHASVAYFTVLLAVFGVIVFATGIVLRCVSLIDLHYERRIRVQQDGGLALEVAALLVILYSLPWVNQWLSLYGWTGIVAGLVAAFTRFRTLSGQLPIIAHKSTGNFGFIVGAALFMYAVFVYAYRFAELHLSPGWAIFLAAVAFGCYFIRIKNFSIGRMYRDRLMETFLPDDGAIVHNQWRRASAADSAGLHTLLTDHDQQVLKPYHLINANAVLVNDEDVRLKGRGGTSFLLSPLFVGSDATGYVDTATYSITIANAMAISGAAANPHTGVGGEGATRNRLVSFLMTFLGIRLGQWRPNPRSFIQGAFLPHQTFDFGLGPLFGFGLTSQSRMLDLSDGGHFENLGLYELFRRRCKLIIASDAGADPKFTFSDLGNAIARARTDFGLTVEFDVEVNGEHYDLASLLPGTAGEDTFTEKFEIAKRGYAIATIQYGSADREELPDADSDDRGTLLYIKSTLTPDLPPDLYSYKAKCPAFPDQSTSDQWFDEVQFEAYRELGYQITKKLLQNEHVKGLLPQQQVSPTP